MNRLKYAHPCTVVVMSALFAPLAHAAVAPGNWTLSYDDEFNQGGTFTSPTAKGKYPDLNAFTYDLGGGGWGNSESEVYTNEAQNVSVSNGVLNITAIKSTTNGVASYTSARLKSNFSQTYGLFEWRAETPAGQGLWPALWMLGTDINTGTSWPACGETDVYESKGQSPTLVQGSLHSSADGGPTAVYKAPAGFSTSAWHVYSLEWDPADPKHPGTTAVLKWYVDGSLYETQYPTDTAFTKPFFLLMNMAVGGTYGGSPTNLANGSYDMQVDYIHVYTAAATPIPEPATLSLIALTLPLLLRRRCMVI